jgi:Leucine-rich repeat (LRR) protein
VEFTSNAAQITDPQVEMLSTVADKIYDLNLAGTKVTDDGLKGLEGMKNLHRLHLEKTAVTDGGLSHLKGLASLEYLNLYNTSVTDAGMAQLEGLKGLKNLYLWQSKVTDAGADGLKKAIPTIAVDTGWKEPAKP